MNHYMRARVFLRYIISYLPYTILIGWLYTDANGQARNLPLNKQQPSHENSSSFVLNIQAIPTFNLVGTRILPGWKVEDDNLSKFFSQDITRPFADPEIDHGQILYLKLDGKYFSKGRVKREKLLLSAKFKAIGNYPQNLLSQPVNDVHRLNRQGKRLTMDSLLIKYHHKWLTASVFSGIGHSDWRDEGDFFNLFPEQFDVHTYKRVSGRGVPRGADVILRSSLGKFQVVVGPELVWGWGKSALAKWNIRLGRVDLAAIYKDEKIVWGQGGEHLRATEISIRTKHLSVAALYSPFRINRRYAFVDEAKNGVGFLNTNFEIKEAQTQRRDAFGTTLEYERENLPFAFKLHTAYTYLGLTAGNKSAISLGLEKMFSENFNFVGWLNYRVPLTGPNPRIFEGTVNNPGPTLLSPRGPEAPFWVTWENRKAYVFSIMMKYDPTPATYLYQYRPNVLESWNLNSEEDASFTFALQYTFSHYPTTTDLQWYINEFGNTVWEPPTTFGLWPTRKPIHLIELLSRIGISRDTNDYLSLSVKAGQSLAYGGFAYGSNTFREKSITGLTGITFGGKWKALDFGLEYGSSVWGPEDWHRRFGETIDKCFRARLAIQTNRNSDFGLNYIRYREIDNKYLAPELGPFDELIFTLRFYLVGRKGFF